VVTALARYPVKSMRGEALDQVRLIDRGLDGDREWAVYTEDGGIGSGKTTRRFRKVEGLLGFRARTDGSEPVVEAPDGRWARAGEPAADDLLSAVLGRPLRLAPESDVPHHDESPVHLVTSAGVRRIDEMLEAGVDVARFRANVVLDVAGTGFPEDGWSGQRLALGEEVVLRLDDPMPRCVMVDLAPDGAPAGDRLLRLLGRERSTAFGLRASVERGGVVRVGDTARLL
jgi:uncharacterized protein YcbX